MDRDGDLDLFRGGRMVPGRYPFPARSYLLLNEGGRFTDVTAQAAPHLMAAGMVCAALWTDYDNDDAPDLLLAGEWMAVTFLKNHGGRKLALDNRPPALTGWWNSLVGGDFDNDGDVDYVAGNLGTNSPYRADRQHPVSIHAADFDGSSTMDAILGQYLLGADGQKHPFPVPSRDVLVPAMPSIRNVFSSFDAYGKADLPTFLARLPVRPQLSLTAVELRTMYFENAGGGRFKTSPLPVQAQFAPVFGMVCMDVNEDGNLDVLLAGNSFSAEVTVGRYDASHGLILFGDGAGHFRPDTRTGLFLEGDNKGLARLAGPRGNALLLAACNNDGLLAFETKATSHPRPVRPETGDARAEIVLANGKVRREELYFGSGYLSQSSRILIPNDSVVSIRLYDSKGKKRTVQVRQ